MSTPEDPKFQARLLDTFRYLCNTDSMNKQLTTEDVNEVKSILKQIQTPLNVNTDSVEEQSVLPKFTDRFRKRLELEEPIEDGEEKENEQETAETSEKGDDTGDDDRTSVTSAQSQISSSHYHHHRRKRKPETYEQTKLKKNYLVILNKLIQDGYTPTQDYTMKDSLQDIKEEIDQYYTCVEATQFVAKRKSNVENGAFWIETGSQFIPKQPLQLQGLTERIKQVHETKQVDSDWERIYYTYRRKRMANPFWGLTLAYGSAIISTTVANYATKKLNNMASTAGGGGGGEGNPLGGIIQNLLGGLLGGGNVGSKMNEMPSMTRDLPTTTSPPQSPAPLYPQSPSQNIPQPARRFQRKVFFPAV